jgi:membrane peptidoglycan carboxypeptidase
VPKSPQVNTPTTPTKLRAQMKELDELFHDGVITQEQRDAAKSRALGI